jgi:hypothetical protein
MLERASTVMIKVKKALYAESRQPGAITKNFPKFCGMNEFIVGRYFLAVLHTSTHILSFLLEQKQLSL